MKKILLLTPDYPPNRGGVANYLWNIYSRLPRESVVVLSEKLSGKIWPRWLPAYFEAVKTIRAEKIESVHISHILPMGYVVWMIKKVFGIPYVVYLHGMDILLAQKSWWKKMWAKKILLEADLVIANSEFTRKEAQKIVDRKIEIVYPCPNISASPEITHDKTNIILSVGRLVARKGFDKVIEAMPKVLREIPEAKYFIVGGGPDAERLKSLTKNLQLDDKVIFYDNVVDGQLPDLYRQCDIFVMPCRQIGADVEGFGIVYLEAALFGKPSVAGRSGGVPEAVLDGKTGIVVNPDNVDEIAAAIIKLLKDDNFRRQLGEAAKNRVQNEFTWEKQIEKIINKL